MCVLSLYLYLSFIAHTRILNDSYTLIFLAIRACRGVIGLALIINTASQYRNSSIKVVNRIKW